MELTKVDLHQLKHIAEHGRADDRQVRMRRTIDRLITGGYLETVGGKIEITLLGKVTALQYAGAM